MPRGIQREDVEVATTYKLYGQPGSGSLAVQMALEEIGARYERIWVTSEACDMAKLRAVNHTGKVTALILPDGTALFLSAAMHVLHALYHPHSRMTPRPDT